MTQVIAYNVELVDKIIAVRECNTKYCDELQVRGGSTGKPCNSDEFGYNSSKGHYLADCWRKTYDASIINGVKAVNAEFNNTNNRNEVSPPPPTVNYYYNLSDFKDAKTVIDFYNRFVDSRQATRGFDPKLQLEQFKKLLVYFIANVLTDEQCSSNPSTGQPRKGKCSHLSSFSDDSQLLIKWHATLLSDAERNIIAKIICNKYSGLPECACINRSSNDIYKETKGTVEQVNDCCWWKPCANSDKFFIPTTEQCNTSTLNSCPSTLCQSFFQNIGGGTIKENDIKNYINCSGAGSGGDSGGGDSGGGDNGGGIIPSFPEWEKVLFFAIPITIFVIALLVYEFPQAKEFIRVHHVAFGLGFLIVSVVSGLVFWYFNFGPGKK